MTGGGGKYEDMATYVRLNTQAEGVVVMVINGTHGEGFSVQATAAVLLNLPSLLRQVADGIEADLKALTDMDAPLLVRTHNSH